MLFGSSEALNLADLRMTLASMCRRSSRQYLFTTAGEVNCTNHEAEWNTSKCIALKAALGRLTLVAFQQVIRTPFRMIHFTDDVDIILPKSQCLASAKEICPPKPPNKMGSTLGSPRHDAPWCAMISGQGLRRKHPSRVPPQWQKQVPACYKASSGVDQMDQNQSISKPSRQTPTPMANWHQPWSSWVGWMWVLWSSIPSWFTKSNGYMNPYFHGLSNKNCVNQSNFWLELATKPLYRPAKNLSSNAKENHVVQGLKGAGSSENGEKNALTKGFKWFNEI